MNLPDSRRSIPVLISLIVAACTAAAPPSSPAGITLPASSTAAPSPPAPTTPSATAEPTGTPAAQLTLGGTWVRPKAGAKLTSYSATLSARPSATGVGTTTYSKVVFKVKPSEGKKIVACTASTPDDGGVWACTADLLALGVPPGPVTLSFDVFGAGVAAARSPDGTRQVTYAVAPPKPGHAGWEDLGAVKTGRWEYTRTYRVRWTEPVGYATEFLVYDTWECPRDSAKNIGKPCFAAGTPVDASQLELLGRASGDATSMKIRIVEPECGPSYGTVLLRARNAYGKSAFAIIEVARVPDPRDMVC